MTVERTNIFSGPYIGNGVTKTFPITFNAASGQEVGVLVAGKDASASSYTVSLADDGTGSVTFFSAPVGSVLPYSNPLFSQEVNFEDQGPFYQSSVNEPIDRAAIRDLVLLNATRRALRAPFGEVLPELPPAAARAGKYQAYDNLGNPMLVSIQPSGDTGGGGDGDADPLFIGDRLNFDAARLDFETDQEAFLRLSALGVKRFKFSDQGRTEGKYLIGCDPFTNGDIFVPGSPNYDPNLSDAQRTALLIEAPGNMFTGLDILGDGKGVTVFLQDDYNYGFMGNALTGPKLKGIRFQGVTFEGNNQAYTTTSQTFHNVACFGVDDIKFYDCEFKASPGDGVYLARTPKPGGPGNHNSNAVVTYCRFDGVNNINRNVLSHEDCDGITFIFNEIVSFTRNGEPGGMDIEPVTTSGILASNAWTCGRVIFAFNRFKFCNGVMFCVQMDPRLSIDPAGMILVEGNLQEDCFSFIDIVGPPDDQPNITRTFSMRVTNNVSRRCSSVLGRIGGGLGVELVGNTFEDADILLLGYGWGNRNLTIKGNTFRRIGKLNGFPILSRLDTANVIIEDNYFEDPGRTDRLGTNAVFLATDGADESGPNPGVVKPRICGVALNRNKVYNTASDGTAGRLTHFAVNNATGGYGPGAAKVGNEFYGTAIPNADTYNPPAPHPTIYKETTLTNGAAVGNQASVGFDIGVSGLTPTTRLEAFFNLFTPTTAALQISALPTSATTARVVVYNGGAGWTVPNGTKLIVQSRA